MDLSCECAFKRVTLRSPFAAGPGRSPSLRAVDLTSLGRPARAGFTPGHLFDRAVVSRGKLADLNVEHLFGLGQIRSYVAMMQSPIRGRPHNDGKIIPIKLNELYKRPVITFGMLCYSKHPINIP